MDLTKRYQNMDGNDLDILAMVRLYPEWSANRIQEGEKAIQLIGDLERALNKISMVMLEPAHIYTQAVRMQDTAIKALERGTE